MTGRHHLNLLTYSGYYDVALRDFGLMLGALTLADWPRSTSEPGESLTGHSSLGVIPARLAGMHLSRRCYGRQAGLVGGLPKV